MLGVRPMVSAAGRCDHLAGGRLQLASRWLQQQLTTARDERKQRLEKRLAEVRADYRERSHKLHQAWELTKSALRGGYDV
jgi:hypothetical protein